jgi:hypothetical protein
MKKLLFLCCFSLLACVARAQDPIGKMIVGLDMGFDVKQFEDGIIPRFIPGIQAEFPIWRFSFGIGLSRKFYRPYEYVYYTGKTQEVLENEQPITFYAYDVKAFNPAYWSVPVKIDFRFHKCRCVYFHAAANFEFLDDRKPERIKFTDALSREVPPYGVQRADLMKKQTRSYEFGIGFKLHSSDYFRVFARPTYVLSENPEVYTDQPKYLSTFRMTFGAQYAFIHY